MAEPLTIPILRDPNYLVDDVLRLEVDGVVQFDRITPWGPERATMGEGYGLESETGEGYGRGLRMGEGISDYGWQEEGTGVLNHQTVGRFVSGDYLIRLRAEDGKGNQGSWSSPITIKHRPAPPAPSNLAVSSGNLTWDWSDP